MRGSSRSGVSSTICGALWTRMEMSSMFFYRIEGLAGPPSVFSRRLIRRHGGEPRKIVTDQLGSDRVAHRAWAPDAYPVTDRYANNRAEQSHKAPRFPERGIRRFKSTVQAQRFLGVHSAVYNLFNLGRHMVRARDYRALRHRASVSWIQVTAG